MRVGPVACGRGPPLHFVQTDGRKAARGVRTGVLRKTLGGVLLAVAPDETAAAAHVAGCGKVPGLPDLGVELLRLAQVDGFAGGFVQPDQRQRVPLHVVDELVAERGRDVGVFLHAVAGPEDACLAFDLARADRVAVAFVEALLVEGFGFVVAFALRPEVGVDEDVHAVGLRPVVVREILGAVGEVVGRLLADEPVAGYAPEVVGQRRRGVVCRRAPRYAVVAAVAAGLRGDAGAEQQRQGEGGDCVVHRIRFSCFLAVYLLSSILIQ